MKFNIIMFVAVFIIAMQAYSQCACCAGACIGSANGDHTDGLFNLPKKGWLIEGYGNYRTITNSGGHHSAEQHALPEEETLLESMLINTIGVRYGITDRIAISALLPYVLLHTHTGNDNGPGDLILLANFNIYSKNNFDLTIQGGAELPTGIQKGANFDNTTVVLGSGSVDPMGGIIFSKRWNKLALTGNSLFKYTTMGFDHKNFGSLSVQNLSLSYRIKDVNMNCAPSDTVNTKEKSCFSWTIFGGYYGEWLDKIKEENLIDENSGYYLGFAALGANLSFRSWSIPFTYSYPLVQHLNGDQNRSGYRIRLGIIKSF
ncbi:MAG: hypothetical protein HYU69_16425 [Bacteroidetes bacterium]|nr:hypothetical protein [Bacteroidota bacterium]